MKKIQYQSWYKILDQFWYEWKAVIRIEPTLPSRRPSQDYVQIRTEIYLQTWDRIEGVGIKGYNEKD